MKNIKILDCTLRDGGYVNDFKFFNKNIKEVINKLSQANIDIVECGFLMEDKTGDDITLYNSVEKINEYLPLVKKPSVSYVAMIALGDFNADKLSTFDNSSIDGIRLTFHKFEINEAVICAKKIINKGYKLYFQPVGTTSYSDKELLELIEIANELKPYAFYIVDTLSVMFKYDVVRLFSIINNNLSQDIAIGYHSHNNLQQAFSNAQELADINANRLLILDSSIYGMGRGAGNLCTELITEYINRNNENKYDIEPILSLIDNVIFKIYSTTPWGYNVPYYLASVHKCHPNYATCLLSKQSLTASSINDILSRLNNEKKDIFDKKYIEECYIEYLSNNIDDAEEKATLHKLLFNKNILILGAGESLVLEESKIKKFIAEKNPIIFSVNFCGLNFNPEFTFVSNIKRWDNMDLNSINCRNIIATSNIKNKLENCSNMHFINYSSLLNDTKEVFDNAGLMLIKLLTFCEIDKINLAGFDGMETSLAEFASHQLYFHLNKTNVIAEKNACMKKAISKLKKKVDICFLTKTHYE